MWIHRFDTYECITTLILLDHYIADNFKLRIEQEWITEQSIGCTGNRGFWSICWRLKTGIFPCRQYTSKIKSSFSRFLLNANWKFIQKHVFVSFIDYSLFLILHKMSLKKVWLVGISYCIFRQLSKWTTSIKRDLFYNFDESYCLSSGIIFQTSECNTTFGCFRSPEGCDGDACAVIITYALAPNMSDYLDVRMLTNLSWVALGHKPENSTFGMVCKIILLKM